MLLCVVYLRGVFLRIAELKDRKIETEEPIDNMPNEWQTLFASLCQDVEDHPQHSDHGYNELRLNSFSFVLSCYSDVKKNEWMSVSNIIWEGNDWIDWRYKFQVIPRTRANKSSRLIYFWFARD